MLSRFHPCTVGRIRGIAWLSFAVSVMTAAPARAELVYFTTGRTLSVKSHRVDGGQIVLALRSGGEIVTEAGVVERVEPDEIPYPEDAPIAQAAAPDPLVPYGAFIDKVAAANGVPAQLVKAVIRVESAYQTRARSRKGAMGLMQLMPATARQYAVQDPYEPASNIEGGVKLLKSLLDRYDLKVALAAYNAGEAAVKRFGGIPPYAETQRYVADILKLVGR